MNYMKYKVRFFFNIDDIVFFVFLICEVNGSVVVFDNEILDIYSVYFIYIGRFVVFCFGFYVFMMLGSIYGNYEYSCKFYFSNGEF